VSKNLKAVIERRSALTDLVSIYAGDDLLERFVYYKEDGPTLKLPDGIEIVYVGVGS
jgi:hypothetical protein